MESNSYSTLRKHLLGRGDRMERVENPMVPGMFDVSCCLRPGVEIWIELKCPVEPVRDSTPLFGSNHPVLQTQINWARTQIQAGGFAYFYIDTDKRRMMVDARYAEDINMMSVQQIRGKAFWSAMKPTPSFSWQELSDRLRELIGEKATLLALRNS